MTLSAVANIVRLLFIIIIIFLLQKKRFYRSGTRVTLVQVDPPPVARLSGRIEETCDVLGPMLLTFLSVIYECLC